VRQVGSSGQDYAQSVEVDGFGHVYVAGYTQKTLPRTLATRVHGGEVTKDGIFSADGVFA
jgi:hypothetical protein